MDQTRTQPDLQKLLSADFMGSHTQYPSVQALLNALASSFGYSHKLIRQWELDFFIRRRTPFASWGDMVARAGLWYTKQAA